MCNELCGKLPDFMYFCRVRRDGNTIDFCISLCCNQTSTSVFHRQLISYGLKPFGGKYLASSRYHDYLRVGLA